MKNILSTFCSLIILYKAGKIKFSGDWNSVLLKTSSGACCAPGKFALLVTLQGTSVCLTMYLAVYQMK